MGIRDIEISFKLVSLKTEQFAIIIEAFKGDDLETNYSFQLQIAKDLDKKTIALQVKNKFEQNGNPFIIFNSSCHFLIGNETWSHFIKEGDFENIYVPNYLIKHFLVLTVSSARGMLHAKTEGTPLNKFFIPTLELKDEFSEDEVII